LEGPEGVGKTTQLRRLAAALADYGRRVVTLREPGGTQLGERVREVLLASELEPTAAAEALLFLAARAELVAQEVYPALASGDVVLLDRFFLSTYAYQVAGRGLPESLVREANQLAVRGLTPDITIVLSLPEAESARRLAARGDRDRMERSDATFHARVHAAFARFVTAEWQAEHPECGRIVAVDASVSEDEVAAHVTLLAGQGLGPRLRGPSEPGAASGPGAAQ